MQVSYVNKKVDSHVYKNFGRIIYVLNTKTRCCKNFNINNNSKIYFLHTPIRFEILVLSLPVLFEIVSFLKMCFATGLSLKEDSSQKRVMSHLTF